MVSINGKQIGLLDHGFHAMYSCNRLHTMDAALLLISQAEIWDLKVQLGGIWVFSDFGNKVHEKSVC